MMKPIESHRPCIELIPTKNSYIMLRIYILICAFQHQEPDLTNISIDHVKLNAQLLDNHRPYV